MANQSDLNGELPEIPGVKEPPVSMDDLLSRAQNLWRFKKRDDAFRLVIAGMRLLSHGTSMLVKDVTELKKAVGQLGRDVD